MVDALYKNKEWVEKRKKLFRGHKQQGMPRISDMHRYKHKTVVK